jgi:large subunit ribosomal protein L19
VAGGAIPPAERTEQLTVCREAKPSAESVMQNKFLQLVETAHVRADIPQFQVGDTVVIQQKLLDGQKERLQPFEGVVIARAGSGVKETVTLRRIVQGEGVERIFLVHSPRIARIDVKKAGRVRRAKLFYLRDRVGKATKIKEDTKRQAALDTASKAAADEVAKAAAAANKEASPTGESKRAAKRKAKAEAQKK